MKVYDNYGFIDKPLKCPVVKNQLLHKVKSRSKQNKIRTAIKNNPKAYITRADISNPFRKIPHKELLKIAGVKEFVNPKIVNHGNGMISVVEGFNGLK